MRPGEPRSRWRQMWKISFIIRAPPLFITPLRRMHVLEAQRLLVEKRRIPYLVLPSRDVAEPPVVAQRLPIGSCVFFAKMRAAGFLAMQRVNAHQLGQFKEIGDAAGLFQRLIDLLGRARNLYLTPVFLAKLANFPDGVLQAAGITRHPAKIPHELS